METLTDSPVLEINGLSKRIKNKQILDDITLAVQPYEAVGLVGPNGSGKSSLMKCISTAYRKDSGSVFIQGHEVYEDHLKAMASVGMSIESPALYPNLSAMEHFRLYAAYKNASTADEKFQKLIEYCDLGNALRKRTGTYSIGMKQRLAIALALLGSPRLLLLDEPTNGLDPESTFKLRELLKEQKAEGTAILMTSHILGDLEKLCDRFLFIKNGKIIFSLSREEIREHFHAYALEVEKPDAAREILKSYIRKQAGEYFEIDFPDKDTFQTVLPKLTEKAGIRDIYRIESDLEALYRQIYGENS